MWRTGRAIPACFLFRNLSPATTGSGTASSLEIGGGIREGVATREGEASSGPASSRETSRSGIGNRRDVGHGPDGDGHPRLTSPGGCGSVRRLAGPPTPLPFLLCSREGRSSRRPGARSCQKGKAVKPAVSAGTAPSTAGLGSRGLSHRVSRPRPSPRRDFYRYRWCRRSGRRRLHTSTISHSRRSPRAADHQIPDKDPLRFILSPPRPDFPTHRVL